VAAALTRADQAEMFTLSGRSVVAPSVVYLREDGVLLTGEAAAVRAARHPERAARAFKRRLGDPTPVLLGGKPHAVTELLAALLRDVVAEVGQAEGAPPRRVVLTHPANWGRFRRGLFEEVPNLAGLSDVRLVSEPEAAAAHYAATRRLDDGQIVAVYDLGGGTFDVAVLCKRAEGVRILGIPEGIERLGGVDFDEAVFSHVNAAASGALTELDPRDPQASIALARLRQECVLAKEALSVDTEAVVPVFLPGRHFEARLTREEFEDLIRAPIESTVGALSRALRSAQVSPDQLSAVLLVGGSSRTPLVARTVSAQLGRPTVVDAHPKYAVALGAATLAGLAGGGATGGAGPVNRGRPSPIPHPAPAVAAQTPSGPAPEPTRKFAVTPARAVVDSRRGPPAAPPPAAASPARRPAGTPGRRMLVLGVLVVAAVAGIFGAWRLSSGGSTDVSGQVAATQPVRLSLTSSQVDIGDSYFADASGFSQGEQVEISWIGPTRGVMGTFPADSAGHVVHGPIIEKDPPGDYQIVALGLNSGRVASAPLRVVGSTGPPK
jgi:actin-like ATPase involved in cell morphogenesis